MDSELEIYNNALLKLGDTPMTSPDDIGDKGTLCRAFYPRVRDAVLRAYPWRCAKHRVELAQDLTSPEFGYLYRYQLPVLPYCLRVLEIDDADAEWQVEGRYLVTDNATVKILYIKRITDPGLFDTLLIEAIAARLASELAYPITGSVNKATDLWQLYGQKIEEARVIDRLERSPETTESDALIEVR